MQVTLDAIDWQKLTAFKTAERFFEYLDEADDEPEWIISCYDLGVWQSDSATQYFDAGRAVDHLEKIAPEPLKSLIKRGLKPILTENGQLDEFKTGAASDGSYWISVSPNTTRDIHAALLELDVNQLKDLLRDNPLPDPSDMIHDLDGDFADVIAQHKAVVKHAVDRGFGLLGQCG